MEQMDSVINTASRFINELADDIKRMNENTDKLMQIQMENVNSYLQPMKGALQISDDMESSLNTLTCHNEDEIIDV